MAIMEGTRELICRIPVPSFIRVVRAARNASGTTASIPHASADQAWSTPSRSASSVNSTS